MKSTKTVREIFAREYVYCKYHRFLGYMLALERDSLADINYRNAEDHEHACEILLEIFPDLNDVNTDPLIDEAIKMQEDAYAVLHRDDPVFQELNRRG